MPREWEAKGFQGEGKLRDSRGESKGYQEEVELRDSRVKGS